MSFKRKLTQDDLRKAMTEHKKKIATTKKIESPLARYTDSAQLMCILCKTTVRSETVWKIHLNSKMHKENIELAKKTKLEGDHVPKSNIQSHKRALSPFQEPSTTKKVKSILKNPMAQSSNLPQDFFDNSKPSKQNTLCFPVAMHNSGENREFKSVEPNNIKKLSDHEIEMEKEKEKDKGKDTNQTILPEGFFDDPVMDAKVRNVEYKNPIEEEWEKFQKEIKEETAQSAQIIADDQEEATTERQLVEIEEQMRHWSRVMDLVKRKEQVQASDRKQESVEDDLSSGDDVEFDEFLDWRAKNSYK